MNTIKSILGWTVAFIATVFFLEPILKYVVAPMFYFGAAMTILMFIALMYARRKNS